MFPILFSEGNPITDIPNLKAWYDATTLTGADGSSVSSWLDQSGNEAHMFQGTSAAQPILKTNILNGRPVVRFDGVDDFLNMTAPFDVEPIGTPSQNANSFSNNGKYYTQVGNSSVLYIYKKVNNVFQKLSQPSTMPVGGVGEQAWSSSDEYLVVTQSTSPRMTIYQRSGDTFTVVANPATIPSGTGYGCAFSNNDNYLAIGSLSSPYIQIYKTDKTVNPWTFTKLSDPATLPTGTVYSTRFSPDDAFLACASATSPFVQVYSRSGDVFTKIADPATLPTTSQTSVSWLNSTTFAICGTLGTGTNYCNIYKYNGTTFELDVQVDVGATNTQGIAYSRNKDYLAVALGNSPRFRVFKVSGSTYTLLSNPASLPVSTGRGVAWGANDEVLAVAHSSSPNAVVYKRSGDTFTNMNRLNMLRNVNGSSIFAVVKFSATASSQSVFYTSNGTVNSSARTYLYQRSTTGIKYTIGGRRLDADLFQAQESSTTVTSTFVVHSGVIDYANNDAYVYLNGSLNSSTTTFQTQGLTSDTDSLAIQISNSTVPNFLNGDIAEIIVYNRALSDNEIKNVHQYLGRKWGITIA